MNALASARIVLTGAKGMLGSAFRQRLSQLLCLSRADLDSAQWVRLSHQLKAWQPDIIINAAADTDVEGSQTHLERARMANVQLPQWLAEVAAETQARLVHFSSTGCYGDYKEQPYTEADVLKPTTVHHQTKAEGEVVVRQVLAQSLILRLGWLFGGDVRNPKNFVWARMQEAQGKSEMYSDPTQVGNPTWVEDVVTQTLALLEANLSGTFNCVATGSTSRFNYVEHILKYAGLTTHLLPKHFERKAPVSPNEAALNQKLEELNMNLMPTWELSLKAYVESLRGIQ